MPIQTTQEAVLDVRRDLAAALRIAAKMGFHEGTCNHFSAVVPGAADCYLINPFGLHFSEVRASDLLMLDSEGNIVEGSGTVEDSAFFIHSSVHRSNPRAACVLHTHMPYATAITSLAGGRLAMCHQNATRFFGRIAYDDEAAGGYNGLALGTTEGDRIARALGDKTVVLLNSHGPMVVGPTIAQAFDDLYYLERAAQVQILAASTGRPLAEISDAVARSAAADFAEQAPVYSASHFDALKRQLDREDPSWRD
ncbi:aldolase [Paraburkholderia sp. RL17-337-BIB-A]|uniref:aldolase n=1 Tax=Paraburkholderia sp. RL17-337-BIB-A TaxID=3031636 RepID=UPI0038BD1184